jgi:hypothetical protein
MNAPNNNSRKGNAPNNNSRKGNANANNSMMPLANMGPMNRKNRATRKNTAVRKSRMSRRQSGGAHMAVGSRIQVMHGTADHTAGGLKKNDLMMHKGRIVSRKAHAAGKKAIQRLRKAGYIAKKGHFKLFTKKH